MKCSICGAELEYGSNICKYCGNAEPEPTSEPLESEAELRAEPKAPEPKTDSLEPPRTTEPKTPEENTEDEDMSAKHIKKKHTARAVVILILAMAAIFAATFAVFFHMLGGSFKKEEPTETPQPVETEIVTKAPEKTEPPKATKKPPAATKAPQKLREEKPADEPIETEAPVPTEDTRISDYLFDSEHKVIRESELKVRTREEIKYIYYEILARHGYEPQDAELKAYFMNTTWYEPTTSHREVAEAGLNPVEKENIEIIEEYQREQGWR